MATFLMAQCVHHHDVIKSEVASHITSLTTVYSTVYSGAYKKYQSSTSLVFVRGIQRSPVNSLDKGPVTRKMFPFDDVIIFTTLSSLADTSTPENFIHPSQLTRREMCHLVVTTPPETSLLAVDLRSVIVASDVIARSSASLDID